MCRLITSNEAARRTRNTTMHEEARRGKATSAAAALITLQPHNRCRARMEGDRKGLKITRQVTSVHAAARTATWHRRSQHRTAGTFTMADMVARALGWAASGGRDGRASRQTIRVWCVAP